MPSKPTSKSSSRKESNTSSNTSSATARKRSNAVKTPSLSDIWESVKRLLFSQTTRVVAGILLIIFALYAAYAMACYPATYATDQSILDQADGVQHRQEIDNPSGIFGAHLANMLINDWFGFPSFILIFMLLMIGLRLVRTRKRPLWNMFCRLTFWLLWLSVTIGFLFHHTYTTNGSSFLWAGRFGDGVSQWLVSYIRTVGTGLLLLGLLIGFLIIAYRQALPTARQMWHKFELQIERIRQARLKLQKDIQEEDEAPKQDNVQDTVGESVPNTADKTDKPAESADEDNDDFIIVNDDDDIIILTDENPIEEDAATTTEAIGKEVTQTTNENASLVDKVGFEFTNVTPEGIVETQEQDSEAQPDMPGGKTTADDLLAKLGPFNPHLELSHYKLPPVSLLKNYPNENTPVIDPAEQQANKERIVTTLHDYGIEIQSIKATVGPTITLYQIVPKAGTRISKIRNLESDIMLSLSAKGIRIIAPIPGTGTIGIEVPNERPQIVSMHSIIASKKFQEEQKMALPIALGSTITNEIYMFDLAKTPHLLVAGATGQGKSVGLNAIITSLLYKKHPSELKLVLVDPKMVEFSIYKPLEKYYMAMMPNEEDVIITDSTKVISTLNSLVVEMENRYALLTKANCRNIAEYNEKFISRKLNPEKGHKFLPYIVIVIDEFGDFIMVAGKEVEMPIARIAQKARAVGMHMILATQRPSVNIITGIIKANIPTRIAFKVSSRIDSMTILDASGAQQLVGKGDLLYSSGNEAVRVQCAFVDTPEIEDIVTHISQQQSYSQAYQLPEYIAGEDGSGKTPAPGMVDLRKRDSLFTDVARFVVANQQGSTSVIQRHFEIGYNRAGKISDQLEAAGIVGPNKGPKGREVLVQDDVTLTQILEKLNRM
ncbi:MAG: DNA translocase FtsK [Paludibacteraceae bacterium]|nr:DNA translocase FtsK [Paludibacteraceae bacterium]